MRSPENKYSVAATPLPDAILFSLVQQAIIILLSAMILDGGNLLQACLYGIAAFWIGVGVIWFRRRVAVTRTDVFLIRWGALPLCVISFFVTGLIWRQRGQAVFF